MNTIYFTDDLSSSQPKSGRRFVYIEPSLRNLQYVPPEEDSLAFSALAAATTATVPGNNILAAVESEGDCWNRTFKIRVTSKKTGKKVDLNVTFKNSGVVDP